MKKYPIILAAIFFSSALHAQKSISDKTDFAQAHLQILNTLALKCDVELRLYDTQGLNQPNCTKLITNAGGKFMQDASIACMDIMKWRDKNIKNPADANQIMKINNACNPENYPHITQTLAKIKALQQLQ